MKKLVRFLCCVFAMIMVTSVSAAAESFELFSFTEAIPLLLDADPLSEYSDEWVSGESLNGDYANMFISYSAKGRFDSTNTAETRLELPWSIAASDMDAYAYVYTINDDTGNYNVNSSEIIISGVSSRYCSAETGTTDDYLTRIAHTVNLGYDGEESYYTDQRLKGFPQGLAIE